MKCVDATEVMRLFAGDLPGERAELLHVHFERCTRCAGLYDELGTMTARLGHQPGEFDDAAAVDEVMTLIRMGKADRPEQAPAQRPFWSAWQSWLFVPVTAAATAAVMLMFWPQQSDPLDHGFQARGAATSVLDRWVSLQVFRTSGAGYEPVRDVVAADDALAFTYLNRPPSRLSYLTVVGVDERGKVFWYYSPSVAIQSGSEAVELPEQVQHDLVPGTLRIFGLFSTEPLSPATLEAQLSRDLRVAGSLAALERIDLPALGQHSLLLKVGPRRESPP